MMDEFAVTTEPDGRVVISGELDVEGAAKLRSALLPYQDQPVVVDLSRLTFIDSRGLSALLRLRHANPLLTLVNVTHEARRLFELTGTTRLLLGDI